MIMAFTTRMATTMTTTTSVMIKQQHNGDNMTKECKKKAILIAFTMTMMVKIIELTITIIMKILMMIMMTNGAQNAHQGDGEESRLGATGTAKNI